MPELISFPGLMLFLELGCSCSAHALQSWEVLLWKAVSTECAALIRRRVSRIHIRGCRGATSPGASVLAGLTGLTTVSLRNSHALTDEFVAHSLAALSSLTSLDLSFCPKLTLEGLNRCTKLNTLKAAGTAITDHALIAIMKGCTELTQLDLTLCLSLTDAAFVETGRLAALNGLVLANCTGLRPAGLVSLSRGGRLTELNVAGCDAVSDNALLEVFNHNACLKALNVTRCCRLTDAVLVALSQLDCNEHLSLCAGLHVLNLSDCHAITDNAIGALAAVRTFCLLLGIRSRRIGAIRDRTTSDVQSEYVWTPTKTNLGRSV